MARKGGTYTEVVVEGLNLRVLVEVLNVEGGSDEQNDVSDGEASSWWRPLTECRPLYSTPDCTMQTHLCL